MTTRKLAVYESDLSLIMDFLSEYWTYIQSYEIPRNYAFWSGLSVIGALTHRKVIYLHGELEFFGSLYVGLIGPQGGSKSTCNLLAKRVFLESALNPNVGPSRASPESLCKIMNDQKFERTFVNWRNENDIVRPMSLFINEFSNFLGRSPYDMIQYIVDIYDVSVYDASTIARGLEIIIKPAMNILMCATPEWFTKNIKGDLLTGGFCRRFVLVYEFNDPPPKPFVEITPVAARARAAVVQRLKDCSSVTGEFKWAPNTLGLYEKWYRDNHARRQLEKNQMMRGYLKSKNAQLYKAMMLLDRVQDKPMFLFTPELMQLALSLLDSLEENMPRLSMSAGRNEMMASQVRALDILKANNGWLPEKQLKRELEADLTPTEMFSVLKFLEDTDQIVKRDMEFTDDKGIKSRGILIMLPERYERLKE